MRKVTLPSGDDVILSDTVGFISDLPTELVAAFRATLEEVLDADVILHVRDISHAQTEEQATDVEAILASLGVGEGAAVIEVWNKIDQLDTDDRAAVITQADRTEDLYAVSAVTGDRLAALLAAVATKINDPKSETTLSLTFAEGRARAWLFDQGVVQEETQVDTGYHIKVSWTAAQQTRFEKL